MAGGVIAAGLSATAQPPLGPPVAAQLVTLNPPAPRREVLIEWSRPGRDYAWRSGFWDWRATGWVWVSGRWALRPKHGDAWVPAEYVRARGHWRYVPAHWSSQRVVNEARKRTHASG